MTKLPANLCKLFAQAVERCPENLAVDHEQGCLTYRELDEASSALASDLFGFGVGNGSPVLLVTAHGTFNIVAILAILKAGGCFVPIDRATWSPEMINHVCNAVEGPVVINTTAMPFAAPDELRRTLHIDKLPQLGPGTSPDSSPQRIDATDTACIIFTSGSTGRPKGVMISHKSLCLCAKTSPVNVDITPGDRLLHMLSVAFDACTCMLFATLGNCGTVVPTQAENVFHQAPSCTVMAVTPSLLSNLPMPTSDDSIFSNMHSIIVGGETATPDLLGAWVDAGVRVLAAYGVTETTSMGTIHNVERDAQTGKVNHLLIGGWMEESPVWLIDPDLGIISHDGIEGEIVIGGDGVAKGYYEDDHRTKSSFINWNGSRVYRTGDYGRWVRGPAGDRVIEFRGRRDRTVKNRGFLVNLDRDVEDGLYRAGKPFGVKSVHVAATENGIIAVVTPSAVNTSGMIERAKQSMCSYCIPSRIEAVEDLPLSANGKVQPRILLDMIASIDKGNDSQECMSATASTTSVETQASSRTEEDDKLQRVLRAAEEVLTCPGEKSRKLRGEDSFMGMGGSSLLAFKLVSVLGQSNLQIAARELFECRKFSEIAQLATERAPCSNPRAPWISKDPTATKTLTELRSQARNTLGLADQRFDVGPLTSFQLELALPTMADESKNINQIKLAYSGTHAGMVQRAWQAVWQTEPVFRTELSLMIGCGGQIIHKRPFRKPIVQIYNSRDEYDATVREASMAVGLGCRLDFLAYRQSNESSTASRRGSVVEADELTVVLTIHHSLMDGLSLRLLLENVERAARGLSLLCSTSPIDANLGLLAIQRAREEEVTGFFARYLEGVLPESSAPEYARIEAQGKHGPEGQSMRTAFFGTSVSIDKVQRFARQNCVSTACVYYTAWAMAIGAIENNSNVVVGAVFSNRAALLNHDNTIGAYISTLPLVLRFNANEDVAVLLQRTMDDLATVGEYAWARSDQVGVGSRMWNLLSMQLPLPDENANPPAIRVESLENSDFPLCCLVESNGSVRLLYDSARFDEGIIQRVGQHFEHSLHCLHHETRVGDCMRVNQIQETLFKQAQPLMNKVGEHTVKQVLEQSMDRFSAHIALEDCIGGKLTYRELDRLANIIAHHINAILPDAKSIALYGDGTIGWILGLLGILKAGCIYIPLDPQWPVERRAMVCDKSGASALLLPSAAQASQAPAIEGLGVLAVDSMLSEESNKKNDARLPDSASPDSTLSVVFTSGTTGTPKGAPISNRGFLALQSNPGANLFAAPGSRIAQFMSPAFDVCNVEIFAALLHGATLVLRDPLDPYAHLSRVNTAIITPSVLAALDPNEFANLDIVYSTGEPVTSALVSKFATRMVFYNAYGPAECSVWASLTRMVPGEPITIGRPLSTVRVYILNEEQREVPDGARGEIYLAGVQVLQEYINAPEQTTKNILRDPWHEGERMYRTGDYGSRGRDGRVTYMGRIDRQVKIRGFRVELAGVEQAIMSGPADEGIAQCAALAVNGTLVAYVVFGTSQSIRDSGERIVRLHHRLRENLLPSWVPQVILPLDGFARTANGKIDVRDLEVRFTSSIPACDALSEQVPGPHSIKDRLSEEWRQVLRLEPHVQLQDSDDFLRLGGHSVLVMLLATRLTVAFGVKITVRELLPAPSFRGQLDAIQSLLQIKAEGNQLEETIMSQHNNSHDDDGCLPTEELTELEQQIWFQYQVATTVTAFNIAKLLHLEGAVDTVRLVESLNAALESDPVLRSNILEGPDGPTRVLRDHAPTVREVAQLDIDVEVNYRFDLARDDLIRIHFLRNSTPEERDGKRLSAGQLLIVTSHVIADLGTLQNLLRLTSMAYSGTALTSQARPRHLDSLRWRQRPSLGEQMFWKEYLSGHGYSNRKPALLRRSPVSSTAATFQGASRTREFSGGLVTNLNALIRRVGITHHQLGLAAAALLLQWLSAEDDLVLGSPNANRSSTAEQEALGQFLDRLPIRVNLARGGAEDGVKTTTAILTEVRDSALEALANAISFSNILKALGFPAGELHHHLFECMVTFHPRNAGLDNWLQLPGCRVTTSSPFSDGAKFILMLEWFELDHDRWSLHIEHDTNHLLPAAVDLIEDALKVILDAMGDECTISELRARLPIPDSADLDGGKAWIWNSPVLNNNCISPLR